MLTRCAVCFERLFLQYLKYTKNSVPPEHSRSAAVITLGFDSLSPNGELNVSRNWTTHSASPQQ